MLIILRVIGIERIFIFFVIYVSYKSFACFNRVFFVIFTHTLFSSQYTEFVLKLFVILLLLVRGANTFNRGKGSENRPQKYKAEDLTNNPEGTTKEVSAPGGVNPNNISRI
jgi:hypothetical protein